MYMCVLIHLGPRGVQFFGAGANEMDYSMARATL